MSEKERGESGQAARRPNILLLLSEHHRWDWLGVLGKYPVRTPNIDRLAQGGMLFSADHGEMLGDHNCWNKGQPRDPSVHVPLIVSGPGIQRGQRSDALVELIDLAATFVELAGIAETPPEWDARSLVDVLRGKTAAHREFTTAGFNDWGQVCDGRYKYVEDPVGEPVMLYDLRGDPDERRNVLSANPQIAARLSGALATELKSKCD